MNGSDHEPDIDGDTITALVVSPKTLLNPMILSNTSFRNRALLQPLQSGVFPYPVNCNNDIFLGRKFVCKTYNNNRNFCL